TSPFIRDRDFHARHNAVGGVPGVAHNSAVGGLRPAGSVASTPARTAVTVRCLIIRASSVLVTDQHMGQRKSMPLAASLPPAASAPTAIASWLCLRAAQTERR